MLTRAGKIQETRDVTWEAPPSHVPPPQRLLPIEEAGEGGEESDDDVEAAEVWPLVGRGVPHVRVKRKNGEVALGRVGSEAGSGGGVDLQSDVQPPSSPLSISGPPLEVGSPSPETVERIWEGRSLGVGNREGRN